VRPPLVPPPLPRFSGPIADFYRSHIEPNLPSPAAVRAMHELLVQYVADDRTSLFVVRRFDGCPRGTRFPAHGLASFFVCGDNEPALWFYARAFLEDFGERISSVAEAVQTRSFPIGFARRTELGESQEFWPNWGKERWESHSFSGIRLYHAHLFDAANGIPSHTLDRENLQKRMVRLLHPANHFPMPTHLGQVFYTARDNRVDLSEVRGVKSFVCDQFSYRYRDVWTEFLALADADPSVFPHVGNLLFECTQSNAAEPPAPPVVQQKAIRRKSTRFRVDEEMYQALVAGDGPLVITVTGGTGQRIHPSGTYVVPREVAQRFIESKRGQPNWDTHQNFHSVSIPTTLRDFFQSD